MAIYDLSADDAASEINNSDELLTDLLASIQTLADSDQRTFLLQALHAVQSVQPRLIHCSTLSEHSIGRIAQI
jgi:hypothetical protein